MYILHIEIWAGGGSDMQGCSVLLVTLQVKRIMSKLHRTEYQKWCIRITTASNSAIQFNYAYMHCATIACATGYILYIGVYCTCMHGLTVYC